jgi:hypothetical protein
MPLNQLKLLYFYEFVKKVVGILKKGLRVFGVRHRTPFTGGAEALTGRQTGRGAELRGSDGGTI